MARVTTHTKSNRGKHVYRCIGCGEEIVAGQSYYEWHPRSGARRRHVACGYPRPTELSSRKTAAIEEACQDAEGPINDWSPAVPSAEDLAGLDTFEFDADVSDLESIIEGVAEKAREVGQEYTDGADNMPDSLQYSPTAEAMREVGEELERWADDLADGLSSVNDPDIPERDEEQSDEDWHELIVQAIEEWADQARSAATEAFGDMPEYQG